MHFTVTDNAKDSLYKCDTNFKLLLDPIYAACPVNLATFSLEINNNCTELECTVLYRTENIGQVTPDIFFMCMSHKYLYQNTYHGMMMCHRLLF